MCAAVRHYLELLASSQHVHQDARLVELVAHAQQPLIGLRYEQSQLARQNTTIAEQIMAMIT